MPINSDEPNPSPNFSASMEHNLSIIVFESLLPDSAPLSASLDTAPKILEYLIDLWETGTG